MLLSYKKNLGIYNNMDGTGRDYVKPCKSGGEKQTLDDFIDIETSKAQPNKSLYA